MEQSECKRKSFESNDSIETSFSKNSYNYKSNSRKNKSVSFDNIDIISVDNYKNVNRSLTLPAFVISENYKQVKLEKKQALDKKIREIKIDEEIYPSGYESCFNCLIY
jgi:uncharacterized protein YkuJ